MDSLNISKCTLVDIVSEGHRFIIHIIIVSFITSYLEGKDTLDSQLLRTILATAMSVIIYNVLIKRFVDPKLKKLKKMCDDDK